MMFSIIMAAMSIIPQPVEAWPQYGVLPLATPVEVKTDAAIPSEGYRLDVNPSGKIVITKSDAAGEFYARQTLAQLTDMRGYRCALIKDSPAYRWRGLLLDECRHFFGKDVVKKMIDLMAQYKLNVFHWHLTDDQGWRLDVPGYPDLVKYGAVRPASPKYGASMQKDASGEWTMDLDGQKYGPFYYTEADIREVVAYAAERHVKIVPEIELPGHVYTVLCAYPELACFPENIIRKGRLPRQVWGIEKDVLCIGNDKALKFMEDLLDYVCKVFPSDVVHIGGDECPQVRWHDCPKCQKRIKDAGLKDVKALQPWITSHFVRYLAARGKRTLGWDEYLLGDGIPKSAMGMSWRIGKQGAGHDWLSPADLAARGHDVVMTPNEYCYLDYDQGLEPDPFQNIGGCVPLKKVHSLDPCEGVPDSLRKHIVGGQWNCWTEYTWNRFDLEWKTWPRACAIAEVFWSGAHKTDYNDFRRRMADHRKSLLLQGVNCAPIE